MGVCCIKKEDQEDAQSLKENFLHDTHPAQHPTAVTKTVHKEQPKAPPPPNAEQKIEQTSIEQIIEVEPTQLSLSKQEQVEQEPQKQQVKAVFKSGLKLNSHEDFDKIKRKSDLWQEESGNKILYNIYKKEEEMLFTFKITKVKVEEHYPINYILQPLKYSHKLRNKPVELTICLIISPRPLSILRAMIPKCHNQSHVKPIFGLLKLEEDEKLPRSYFQNDSIHQIVVLGKNCIRLQSIDRIIINLRDEKDFSSILHHCRKITEQFQLQDIIKISFILPSFVSLSEISLLLAKLVRKFLTSEKLEQIIKYLGYHIELLETITEQFEEVIIVSNNLAICELEELTHKEFEVKLELAIGLLMIDVDYNNFKIYESLMLNFLTDKTIADYLKFIQFVHKEKKEFINKLAELKIFDENQLEEIENSKKIQEKIINNNEKSITIKHRNKKRLGDLFREYKNTKTPVEQLEKKKEWDDDLKEHDIKATIMDKHKSSKALDNCNIFEIIDEHFVESTDLALLPGEDELVFQQDD